MGEPIEVCIMCGENFNEQTLSYENQDTEMSETEQTGISITIDSHPDEWNEILTNIPIQNLGNTCYINAALQMLLHSGLFGECMECFTIKSHATMRDMILILRQQYTCLQDIILTEQCDATLFFKYLLDFMKDRQVDGVEQFLCKIKNIFYCEVCESSTKSTLYDTMLTIYVSSYQAEYMQCYTDSITKNIVERRCDTCAENTTQTQKWIVHSSMLLFYHIVYSSQHCSLQEIPTIISFTKPNTKGKKIEIYHLYCFIEHRKPFYSEENHGHYVCFAKEENEEWIEYNDEKCNVIPLHTVLSILQPLNTHTTYVSKVVCLGYRFHEEIDAVSRKA
jgi:hypothetical protein